MYVTTTARSSKTATEPVAKIVDVEKVGILGTGRIGGFLADALARAGHAVETSHLTEMNPKVVANADIVIVAVPWMKVADAVKGSAFSGKLVIDATNPFDGNFQVVRPSPPFQSALEENASRFVGGRLVKAFNTLPSEQLAQFATPVEALRTALPICGDDSEAKVIVARIVDAVGYDAVDIGTSDDASAQEPHGVYYMQRFRLSELKNAEVARRFVVYGLARGDGATLDKLVAEDVVVTSGISPLAPMVGKAAFFAGLGTLGAFSNVELVLEDVLPKADRVTVRYTSHGTHTGDQLGVAATQKRITMKEIRLMRIRDGQIVEDFVADINYDWPWLVAPRYRDAWLAERS